MSANAHKASLNTGEKKDFAKTRRQSSSSFMAGALQCGEEQPVILAHVHGAQRCSCVSSCVCVYSSVCASTRGTSCFPELKNVRCDGSIKKRKNQRSPPEAKRWSTPVRKKHRSKPLPVQHHRYSRHAPDYTHFCQTSTCTVTITTSRYSGIADGWETKTASNLPANKLVFLPVQHWGRQRGMFPLQPVQPSPVHIYKKTCFFFFAYQLFTAQALWRLRLDKLGFYLPWVTVNIQRICFCFPEFESLWPNEPLRARRREKKMKRTPTRRKRRERAGEKRGNNRKGRTRHCWNCCCSGGTGLRCGESSTVVNVWWGRPTLSC